MRIISYMLIGFGILLFASAGYDEFRGITRSPSYSRSSISYSYTITRQTEPEQFHNAMTYHWFYATIVVIAGIIAYFVDRGQEKSDPMSPDYAGNQALDDWSDAMKKEEERRKHPEP